ncbi:lysine transporter LysE [Caulobacter sp. Root1455]|uniref:LysE family translocator n=1 Tax=Caulobacter sp. Root1455 TaxID=1736465 RepID=UPI000701E1EE|nr:LysE family translocator [Caulobacter sp. Root1455]KQY95941.1 lysine transporter LysE [Caulobacter sp. Root1455]
MTTAQALIAFALAAGLLTITPGLDTALVLRTAAAEGWRRATAVAVGIGLGCLAWGAAAAFGAGALLVASHTAYTILKWAGAAYLVWLGLNLLRKPRAAFDADAGAAPPSRGLAAALAKGFWNNLLNPKVGVFYVSFLPQFIPTGAGPAAFGLLLASIHVVMGLAWAGGLILATAPIARALRKPGVVKWLDRVTGGVFVAFGVRIALERR